MGEAKFGLMDGVLSTLSGWLGKVEVVKLEYDPAVVTYETLVKQAKAHECATIAFPQNDAELAIARKTFGDEARRFEGEVRPVKDTKYYLRRTPLKHVPMTRTQASRLNGDVKREKEVLSPRQLELLAHIRKHPDAGWKDVVDQDLMKAWAAVERLRKSKSR